MSESKKKRTEIEKLKEEKKDVEDIQEWLGHSDIGTTSNIYTHLDYSAKIAAANKILGYFPQ